MKLPPLISFVTKAIISGLAVAFLAVWLWPDIINRQSSITIVEAPPGNRAAASDHQVSYAQAVARAVPAVVNIFTTKVVAQQTGTLLDDPFFRQFFAPDLGPTYQEQSSLGSGVIVSQQGYVLTNNHVVSGASEIRVAMTDGRQFLATVVGTDPDTDLAVLTLDAKNLPFVTLAAPEDLQVGDIALAIGNPFGVGQTVTQGIVSATGRNQLGINTFENFIQTDAAINPGNSGGALINSVGNLIGINTAIFSQTGSSNGIGFAIPISLGKKVMEDLIRFHRVIRGFLGIQGRDITPELAATLGITNVEGALVTAILRNGPAATAKITPGDVILSVEGKKIQRSHEVMDIVASIAPGTKITIGGLRNGQPVTWEAVVAERPLPSN